MKRVNRNIFCLLCLLLISFTGIVAINAPVYAAPTTSQTTEDTSNQYIDTEEATGCKYSVLQTKYMEGSTCWYCFIVGKMTSAYLYAASLIVPTVKTMALMVLRYGFLIWLALYILKQISSLSPITTGKFLQEILMMGFKVMLATLIINNGIPFFNAYIITPLIDTGIDIGNAIFDTIATDFDIESGGGK